MNCYKELRAGGKLNRTVFMDGNANGVYLLPGKRLPATIVDAARARKSTRQTRVL